jgi:CBS domain-containing protein
MNKKEPVSHIMTKSVHAVQAKESLLSVKDLINKHKIRHVPVLDGKNLIGIISQNDINRLAFSNYFEVEEDVNEAVFEMLTIPQVMTHHPRVVNENDTIKHIAQIFSKEEFHALPVVDAQDASKLVGIVTTTDVIRYMLEQYS